MELTFKLPRESAKKLLLALDIAADAAPDGTFGEEWASDTIRAMRNELRKQFANQVKDAT